MFCRYVYAEYDDDGVATAMRSSFAFATPFEGFDGATDRPDAQAKLMEKWLGNRLLPYLNKASGEGLRVTFGGDYLTEYVVLDKKIS